MPASTGEARSTEANSTATEATTAKLGNAIRTPGASLDRIAELAQDVIAATATTHRYWEFAEPARRAQEINFFKNVGILGNISSIKLKSTLRHLFHRAV